MQMDQMAQEGHTIFDRPLDPYLQEGSSAVPSNAKMSIVTADSNAIRDQINQQLEQDKTSYYVMSRMSWLWALRPLFDSLRSYRDDHKRARHVEKVNFLDALEKVKPSLDLRDPADDATSSSPAAGDFSETVISFEAAWKQFDEHLPEFFTWDNLFDVLLFNTVAAQFVYDLH